MHRQKGKRTCRSRMFPPAQASLLLSLESVFGVVFSVLLYGEQLTSRLVSGFALIFAAILVSETFPLRKRGG